MPRLREYDPWACGWLRCLNCGARWVAGMGAGSRHCCTAWGCGSRRVAREVTANRFLETRP